MRTANQKALYLIVSIMLLSSISLPAQDNVSLKYDNSLLYSGIEVGSKGVKMSLLEVGKNAKNNGSFNVLKDTSVNTDFISFSAATFSATLEGLSGLYDVATKEYNISPDKIFTVVSSGAYNMNDYIAFSGGIAWATATLMRPELINNSIVTVTYDEVLNFSETLYKNYAALSDAVLVKTISEPSIEKAAAKEIKRVNKVFDQRSMMAGTGLLLKIMRQFKSIYETKQFYLVKNGQVGWISAYVDQHSTQ
ncbi:MAG: hypothetical protein ACXWV6_00065 [Chitinophagaceae bacterium]